MHKDLKSQALLEEYDIQGYNGLHPILLSQGHLPSASMAMSNSTGPISRDLSTMLIKSQEEVSEM